MQYKFLLAPAIFLVFFLSDALAQTSQETVPKTISGGVLNGKAINLVKPPYPKEAKDAKAEGAVLIQITVDEDGNVISAAPTSGNKLLLQVSEQAARASKFSTTTLAGQRVRVTGILVYNFVLPMSFVQIGYELALAQKTSKPEVFPLSSLAGTLPSTWKEEKDLLFKLESFSTEKLAAQKTEKVSSPKPDEAKEPVESQPKNTVKTNMNEGILRTSSASINNELTLSNKSSESVEILKTVQTNIADRLRADEKRLWYFQAGRILGSLATEQENTGDLKSDLSELYQLFIDTPSNASENFAKKLKEIAQYSKYESLDTRKTAKLITLVKELRYTRTD